MKNVIFTIDLNLMILPIKTCESDFRGDNLQAHRGWGATSWPSSLASISEIGLFFCCPSPNRAPNSKSLLSISCTFLFSILPLTLQLRVPPLDTGWFYLIKLISGFTMWSTMLQQRNHLEIHYSRTFLKHIHTLKEF